MKMFSYPKVFCLLLCFLVISSCQNEFDLAATVVDEVNEESTNDDGMPQDDGEGDMTDPPEDNEDMTDDSNSGSEVSLTANADILSNNGEGPQTWDENVSLSAVKINGDPGTVVFETRFKDDGFGVAGGRWEQIDYYHEYQGEIVKASEKLVIDFLTPVTEVRLQVGQIDPNEGRQAKEGRTCEQNNANKVDESGKWTAYDSNGMEIGQGILLDEFSIEGRLPDSMGSYRFLLDTSGQPIAKIVVEATQWGGEERGCPTNRASYANEPLNDSGNTENNSEFNIMALSYTKV